jgi:type II secretory pathway pseudopilin PulG
LIELLVVMAIIALLMAILLPSLEKARAMARRATCTSNLSGIGKALAMYEADYNEFMQLRDAFGKWPREYDADAQVYAFPEDLPKNSDCNLQHWWLLVMEGYVDEKTFGCPSDNTYEAPNRKPKREGNQAEENKVGFLTWRNVSYGLQPVTHYANAAYPGSATQDDNTMIVAGDKPKETADETGAPIKVASANHDKAGNFLALGGTVQFYKGEEANYGVDFNNVYEMDIDRMGQVTEVPLEKPSSGMGVGLLSPSDTFLFWKDQPLASDASDAE